MGTPSGMFPRSGSGMGRDRPPRALVGIGMGKFLPRRDGMGRQNPMRNSLLPSLILTLAGNISRLPWLILTMAGTLCHLPRLKVLYIYPGRSPKSAKSFTAVQNHPKGLPNFCADTAIAVLRSDPVSDARPCPQEPEALPQPQHRAPSHHPLGCHEP
jgi:hypothetical protein